LLPILNNQVESKTGKGLQSNEALAVNSSNIDNKKATPFQKWLFYFMEKR